MEDCAHGRKWPAIFSPLLNKCHYKYKRKRVTYVFVGFQVLSFIHLKFQRKFVEENTLTVLIYLGKIHLQSMVLHSHELYEYDFMNEPIQQYRKPSKHQCFLLHYITVFVMTEHSHKESSCACLLVHMLHFGSQYQVTRTS